MKPRTVALLLAACALVAALLYLFTPSSRPANDAAETLPPAAPPAEGPANGSVAPLAVLPADQLPEFTSSSPGLPTGAIVAIVGVGLSLLAISVAAAAGWSVEKTIKNAGRELESAALVAMVLPGIP